MPMLKAGQGRSFRSMVICTIIAKNYVAQARVLADSYFRHNPDGQCSVLVIDDPTGYLDPAEERFELVTPDMLDLPDFERMAAIYDVVELSTAVKPWLLKFLLSRPGCATATYLDPDIEIFDRLGGIEDLAKEHGLVLTPHNVDPMPRDGHKPSETDILIAGVYNLGFITIRGGAEGIELLDWWSERLREDCIVDPTKGYFVDQRWIDLVPGLVRDLYILRDPGYNVAYWNLATRRVEVSNGRYLVNGNQLRFFHYSGFNPLRPEQLSKHQDRIDLAAEPTVAGLCQRYAEQCLDRGYQEARTWPYNLDYLDDGTKLDHHARRLCRRWFESGGVSKSIFTDRGGRAFVDYLNEPTPKAGGQAGVTRYLREFYDARPDLQAAFPRLGNGDAGEFLAWSKASADTPIPVALLAADDESQDFPGPNSTQPGPPAPDPVLRTGVNVAGYLNAELGVGEAARQVITALNARDIPVAPIGIPVETSRQEHAFDHIGIVEGPFPVNLICVNADMLPAFAEQMGFAFYMGRYSIGLWFWEVAEFPEHWLSSFDNVDEIWAASRHVVEAVSARSPIPVNKITLPVVPSPPAHTDRRSLGLPEGFLFLFLFDHHSVFERKNPLGLISAFKQAFRPGSGTALVVKSINGDSHAQDAARLRQAAAAHPDVHLIEGYVSGAEKSAMISHCDCYVSLHRSEGFGLTLAEAMYFGKPVIGTGYSGNLDFMTSRNSHLVNYELRGIGPGAGPYPAEGEWAEPDLEHAARLMRHVRDDPAAATELGRTAAIEIRRTNSPHAAGHEIERHLNRIEAVSSQVHELEGRLERLAR